MWIHLVPEICEAPVLDSGQKSILITQNMAAWAIGGMRLSLNRMSGPDNGRALGLATS
jgi:hypothetical protein